VVCAMRERVVPFSFDHTHGLERHAESGREGEIKQEGERERLHGGAREIRL
jgi:hypothetical protein